MLVCFGCKHVTRYLVGVYGAGMWDSSLERVVVEHKRILVTSCGLKHYTEYSLLKGLEKCETPEKPN